MHMSRRRRAILPKRWKSCETVMILLPVFVILLSFLYHSVFSSVV